MTILRRFFRGLNFGGMDSHVLRPIITALMELGGAFARLVLMVLVGFWGGGGGELPVVEVAS